MMSRKENEWESVLPRKGGDTDTAGESWERKPDGRWQSAFHSPVLVTEMLGGLRS